MTNQSDDLVWVRLKDLPTGFVFATEDGFLAVKSEYKLTGGKCKCILLQSGEYAHFKDGDDTLVKAMEVSDGEPVVPADIQQAIADLLTIGIEAGEIDPDDDAPGTILGDVSSWLNNLPNRINLVSGHPDWHMEGLP